MNAEVIAVGTELLLGFVVNTDTAYLGRVLAEAGIACTHQVTVGDNPGRLAEAARTALARADLVITCGGLGPTVDDITLETLARVAGRRLVLNRPILRRIENRFRRLGVRMPGSNRRQALLPEGAFPFLNTIGTAPGWILTLRHAEGERRLVALPGPPAELMPMVERHLIPRLRKLSGGMILRSRTLKLTGITESEVDAKVRDLLSLSGPATVGIYAHPGQVDLRITARGKTEAEVRRKIAAVERQIRSRLGRLLLGADEETLEGEVGRLLKQKRKSVAVAESCTGGLVQHRITEVAGSSEYFRGGVIAYSNALKESLLSVPRETLRREGAVSSSTARAMAEGVRELTGSDFGLGITGIAGPTGGSKKKPVGLVYIALAGPGRVKVERRLFSGDRRTVKLKASQAALNLLRLRLLK